MHKLQLAEVTQDHEATQRQLLDSIGTEERLRAQLRRLQSKLPRADQIQLERATSQIRVLREEVEVLRRSRARAEKQLDELLDELRSAVQRNKDKIEKKFQKYASTFFGDRVRLVFAPRRTRVGQAGESIEFPAFEIEMIGSATEGNFARRTSGQVSLSQNYYLDLAFRMAIIDTVSSTGGALIVDGPEGSVDAVFAELAGVLLADFAETKQPRNQLLVACNVVEGAFLPNLLAKYTTFDSRMSRTVNLVEIANPTPVLEAQRRRYNAAIRRVYSKVK